MAYLIGTDICPLWFEVIFTWISIDIVEVEKGQTWREILTKKIDRGSNHYEKETKNKYVFTHTQKKKQRKGVIKQTCRGLKFNIKVKNKKKL